MIKAIALERMTRVVMAVVLIFFAIVSRSEAASPPQITGNGILNAASDAFPGSPNSSIAQGSIFSIYGSNLGPSSSPAVAYPLQSALGGVSVAVTSYTGSSVNALPIFVAPGLVNAILPGTATVGVASLTVTYNGKTSQPASLTVVANSFGIFSVGSNGTGVGVITDTSYQLYSLNFAAGPGSTAVLWGTGLGASPGDNGAGPPPQINMPSLPLSVYVGTQTATVSYQGRAAFTGEDQINFVIPAGVTGCYVPVTVQVGIIVSNFVTMPIAPAGQSCPDPTPPVPPFGLGPPGTPPFTGEVLLERATKIVATDMGTTSVTTDYGLAFFGTPQADAFPYLPPLYGNPYSLPVGTCTGGAAYPNSIDYLVQELPAGTITVSGPNGNQELPPANGVESGFYSTQIGGGSGATAEPLFLDAGVYTVTAPGGSFGPPTSSPGVGPFSQTITLPPPLIWGNAAAINTIDRSAPLEVTWTGGDPDGTVQITGFVGFICNARASDQHFTIPPFILMSGAAAGQGYLTVGAATTSPFTATGISTGTINSAVFTIRTVTYQ